GEMGPVRNRGMRHGRSHLDRHRALDAGGGEQQVLRAHQDPEDAVRRDPGRARQVMSRAARELRGWIGEALGLLARKPLADEAVHEARKALKKARAALRLLRADL